MNGANIAALLAATCVIAAAQNAKAPGFSFADFQSTARLKTVGDAEGEEKILRLTTANQQRAGAAWFAEKQSVIDGFETTFRFRLTEQGGEGAGADGFAFVLQNHGPEAIAGRGSAGGFALGDGRNLMDHHGIPFSIAVFFDTYQNPTDPSDNYVALSANGRISEMRWPPPRLGFTKQLPVKLKDGKIHTVRVAYRPPILSVYMDKRPLPVLTSTVDLALVTDAAGTAYVGFTASTGQGYENHDILSWSFSPTERSAVSAVTSTVSFLTRACVPDRNLCTPDGASVEQTAGGGYRVVLPAHLEWGASIPNPAGRRTVIENARGAVCWDREALGADGCGGPSGVTTRKAGAGYVVAGQNIGAVVSVTRDGRTYFSINDRRGSSFDGNEGFVEFEVRLE